MPSVTSAHAFMINARDDEATLQQFHHECVVARTVRVHAMQHDHHPLRVLVRIEMLWQPEAIKDLRDLVSRPRSLHVPGLLGRACDVVAQELLLDLRERVQHARVVGVDAWSKEHEEHEEHEERDGARRHERREPQRRADPHTDDLILHVGLAFLLLV
ncbi:hypothetical protein FI667_g8885, partial [Globisporangium splendens]